MINWKELLTNETLRGLQQYRGLTGFYKQAACKRIRIKARRSKRWGGPCGFFHYLRGNKTCVGGGDLRQYVTRVKLLKSMTKGGCGSESSEDLKGCLAKIDSLCFRTNLNDGLHLVRQ